MKTAELLKSARTDLTRAAGHIPPDGKYRVNAVDTQADIERYMKSAVALATSAVENIKAAAPALFPSLPTAVCGVCKKPWNEGVDHVTCAAFNGEAAALVAAFREAADGDSGDLEHDAACALATFVEKMLTNGVVCT